MKNLILSTAFLLSSFTLFADETNPNIYGYWLNLDSEILWLDHKSILKNSKGNIYNSHDDLIKSASKIYSHFDIILIMTNKNSKNI